MLGPCGLDDFWLRCLARRRVDQEAGVTVAGVAGLEAGRLEILRGGPRVPLGLLDVAPVLRRCAGTGRCALFAVLQAGEDADGVGVGRTLGVPAIAGVLSGLRRADASAEQEQGGGGGAQYCSESHVFPRGLVRFSAT
jgi:hypothetical protein